MSHFTPIQAALGGVMIGVAASALLYFDGRIAGISGIAGRLLRREADEVAWRVAFLIGLVGTAAAAFALRPAAFGTPDGVRLPMLALGGLLVGYGTRLANGCTSGHGVCGLGRFSKRSLVATLTFMGTAIAVVFVTHHVLGGAA